MDWPPQDAIPLQPPAPPPQPPKGPPPVVVVEDDKMTSAENSMAMDVEQLSRMKTHV